MLRHLCTVLVFALISVCVAGAEGAVLPARANPLDLFAAGKEAVARYTADPTVHAGAIVDAAVAFELAHRATTASTDSELLNDIQANLFWCRKQMDAISMTQYRARLDALPTARPAQGGDARPAKAAAAPATPAVQPATATAVDAPVLRNWVQLLQQRIRSDLKTGREPHFILGAMKSAAIIRSLADNGTLTLALDGGEMSYPWRLLSAQDLAAIAADLPVGDDQAGHALAAFFQLAAGNESAGRASLQRAGTLTAEVERALLATAAR